MKIFFIIALTLSFNVFLSSNTLFSMEVQKEEKKERQLLRSKSCPELSKLRHIKKIRINKEKELWTSISFLGQRLNAGEKEQRNLHYDIQQTRYLILTLFNQLNTISEDLINAQDTIIQLQNTVLKMQDNKSKNFDRIASKLKNKKKSKDDSTDASLVKSLPFPEEPIAKEKPSEDHFPI